MWQAAWYDLHDGISQLIQQFIDEDKSTFTQQRAIHIVLVLIMVSDMLQRDKTCLDAQCRYTC